MELDVPDRTADHLLRSAARLLALAADPEACQGILTDWNPQLDLTEDVRRRVEEGHARLERSARALARRF